MSELRCESSDTCEEPVTMMDSSGWIYCSTHGLQRREWKHCRKLRPYELNRLKAGKQIKSY